MVFIHGNYRELVPFCFCTQRLTDKQYSAFMEISVSIIGRRAEMKHILTKQTLLSGHTSSTSLLSKVKNKSSRKEQRQHLLKDNSRHHLWVLLKEFDHHLVVRLFQVFFSFGVSLQFAHEIWLGKGIEDVLATPRTWEGGNLGKKFLFSQTSPHSWEYTCKLASALKKQVNISLQSYT